jgi:hypothetical protein
VAPGVRDRIQYTYDFGDGWDHDIVVEEVLDRDSTVALCIGGRRAAPPDDCGGIGGYQELVEIISDHRHPDHERMLEWLGLDDPKEFNAAEFDVNEINSALTTLR